MNSSKKPSASKLKPALKSDCLTLKGYSGDGSALLAFSLDESLVDNLAGFAIKRTAPGEKPEYLLNRLNFTNQITSGTTPEQRTWTPSNIAPFQKFRWLDFPGNGEPGTYNYQVTAMYYINGDSLKEGVSADISLDIKPKKFDNFELGFTRGYLSSQAYSSKFKGNLDIRPSGPKVINYDTSVYQQKYEWLGYHARELVYDFMNESLNDKNISVDLFAYDLDEPDFIKDLQKLGGRLRAFLDDAPLHTKKGALEIEAHTLLVASAGADNVKQGHFHRFAHDKVIIMKKGGKAIKVLTGSANYSVRGLYVQANNVLFFNNEHVANLYEEAFEQSFSDESKFAKSEIAEDWHDLHEQGLPELSVAFSPHESDSVSLSKVADAIQNAKSSVLFAVMELSGGGSVLEQLVNLPSRKDIFSYGMTQTSSGLKIYKPGDANGIIVPFAYLTGKIPAPFQQEFSGGLGQVIHHKFIVIDFNGPKPIVFAGSSNLASGGEKANGDNLLAISDPEVAMAYAIEAVRLVDHYHFRAVMKSATNVKPLTLQQSSIKQEWWRPYYDIKDIKCKDRLLFAM